MMTLTAKYPLTMLTLLVASFASHANGYKMVVINDDVLATLASQADARQPQALNQIEQIANSKTDDAFGRAMNLCVAYTRAGATEAPQACHQAVIQARYSIEGRSAASKTLRAYAYSNRGVARVKLNDKVGALADFQTAVALSPNAINQHNLMVLTEVINGSQPLQVALD